MELRLEGGARAFPENSMIVREALRMDLPRHLVLRRVHKRLQTIGSNYTDLKDLVADLFEQDGLPSSLDQEIPMETNQLEEAMMMNSPVVKDALRRGVPPHLIKPLIRAKILRCGAPYSDVRELLADGGKKTLMRIRYRSVQSPVVLFHQVKKAPSKTKLQQEAISCSICLNPLKRPVTIACGHSYCMRCINLYWNGEDHSRVYICPQCRQNFTPRSILVKSTLLAVLVEQLKETGLSKTPADHCYAGPEDVACDVCSWRKMKAVKSCLVCLVSYCKEHVKPHYKSAFDKHKLVNPSKKLQQNICSRHDEAMKIFCRTDQQCICYLCTMDEHKDHETVPAAAERDEKQKKLQVSLHHIHQRIQDRENDVKLLQQEVEAINVSADKAVEDSENIFTELIRLLQERRSDVKQQIRSQQETELGLLALLQSLEWVDLSLPLSFRLWPLGGARELWSGDSAEDLAL
ncbi:hypothetical protein CCH79_00018609 [Gambusia affinis]|uniref:RING-type domain-containing protein n=1 Tax=Gambusia affinis TaxID=33528 RepID=A0A315VKV2_GAMAF|nr:hypothetical protein CCH79_00018609 [Gambusia affinis]